MFKHKNFIILVSSPSGAGKSTLSNMLLREDENIKLSVSATTREPRPGEENKVHYHFLKKEDFEEKIKNDEFFEYAQVFDNYYGTLKSEVENKFKENKDVLLDIDWQGARLVSQKVPPERLVKIFILPPSLKELERRLYSRGQDSDEVIQKRMKKARDEISHYNEYDFVVVNDDLEESYRMLKSLIYTKRMQNIDKENLDEVVKEIVK